MRHGAAEDTSPTGRDFERALTPAGRAVVAKVARVVRDLLVAPVEVLLASPLVRAQQTAEIVQSILCPGVEIETDEDLTPDASAYDLAVRVAATGRVTYMVGHQPNIEMVARALARPTFQPHSGHRSLSASGRPVASSARPSLRLPPGFRTATVVGFEIGGRPPPFVLSVAIDPTVLADSTPPPAG